MGLAATRRGFGALLAIAIGLLPALVQPVTAGAVSTGTLFGITGMNRTTLSRIDLGTGAVTPIAELGLPPNANAQVTNLTGDPATHRIFALRLSVIVQPPPGGITMISEILTINSQSGALITVKRVNAPIGDLQFDPVSNTLYALVASGFLGAHGVVRLDPNTGAVTQVASIGPPGPFIDSMVVAPQTHMVYVNRLNVLGPLGTSTTQIITVDTLSGTVVSTSPVLSRSIRSISYDTSSNRLFGVTECCPQDLLQINPSSGIQTLVGNVNNSTSQVFQFYQAVDPLSHTVFLLFEFFATFPSETHIFSVNTQTGGSTLGPAIATGAASLYFETAATPPDTSPPTTSIALAPPPNTAGWNNTNVTVNLSATDPDGVADVATVHYSAVGAQTIAPTVVAGSTASFVVNTEGVTTVTYFAKDKAGNAGAAHTQIIRIDKTLPTVTYTGNAGTYTVDQTVAITCTAVDPPNANGTAASGLASTTCANVNAPAYSFPLGPNTFSASATDIAGNIGRGSTTFTVQVTSESLCTLTVQFIETSPKFLSLSPHAQKRWDQFAQRICEIFDQGEGEHGPDDRAEKVEAYREALTHLVDKGFLTPAQSAILLTLSQAL